MTHAGQRALDERFTDGLKWARWAVDHWSQFPVDEIPRPLVMVGARVFVERGFRTGEAKLAFLEGRIDWEVAVPDGVRVEVGRRTGSHGSRSGRSPLVISAAQRGETEFLTDRGPRRLPAWRLESDDALGPIWVLEVPDWRPAGSAGPARPDLQPPPMDPGARIEVAADDRTLTLFWLGASPEYERYRSAEAIESDRAVALIARGEDSGLTGIRLAVGHVHEVPATLRQPLGSRVFVDLHGNAGQAVRRGHCS